MKAKRTTAPPQINPQLIGLQQWLLWKTVKQRDGKERKVPVCADGRSRSGALDTPADKARMVSYAGAQALIAKYPKLKLAFAVYGGVQFIDLDDVIENGTIKAWADRVLKRAIEMGAYVEISTRGRGLHILGYGYTLPTLGKTRHPDGGAAEVYCEKRFCAMGTPLHTGKDTLPDIGPLVQMLGIERKAPDLKVIQGGKASPINWPGERKIIVDGLPLLDPDMPRDPWRNIGMIIHDACGGTQEGLDLWEQWSRGGDKFVEGDCARNWVSFGRPYKGPRRTMASFVEMVHEAEEAQAEEVLLRADGKVDVADDEVSLDALLQAEFPPVQWAVEEMIPPGLTLLSAPPKAGKSYLVLQMAICVSRGVPFLGQPTRKTQAVYYSLEESKRLVAQKARPIAAAHPGTGTVMFRSLIGVGKEAVEDITGYLERGFKLIIVDVFANVRDEMSEHEKQGVYKRDRLAILALRDIMRDYPDTAMVVVHHNNKQQAVEDWQNRISGSTGLASAADTVMMLERLDLRRTDEDSKETVRKHRTLRYVGKEIGDREMMVVQMDNGGGWAVSEATEDEVLTTSRQDQILAILRERTDRWTPGTEIVSILEETDKPTQTQKAKWRAVLARMVKRGKLVSEGKGGSGYRLPE